MDKLDVKFVISLVLFILIGAYIIGVQDVLFSGNTTSPSPYVYPKEYIEEMRKQYSLLDFSNLITDVSLINKTDSLFTELNSTKKCSILIRDLEKDFYSAKIYTFIPTFAYLAADKIECNASKYQGNVSLALSEVEKLLSEIREIERTKGQSPWLAMAELYLEWSQNPNMTPTQAIFTMEYLIPFLREHIEGGYKEIEFDLSNITRTKREIEKLKRTLKMDKTQRINLISLASVWLNMSENAYRKGEKSLALWYYSVSLAYLNLTETEWAKAPYPYFVQGGLQKDRDMPYNITGIRKEVYEKALTFAKKKGKGPYAELLSNYVLLDLRMLDSYTLPKLSNPNNPLIKYYPSATYEAYLRLLGMVVAIESFASYFS
ncbi:hypothetical protein [Pyrococcus abyssi]|nr:hypothetical protein [Pyrococcus abyssi]CAD55690.1 Hypothetical protein PAB0820 [Pyrococcus abyssi GE5]